MDWWTVGIILYEMINGRSPFTDRNPMIIYRKIVNDPVEFTDDFDSDAKDLILRLLDKDPLTRITE